MYKKYVGVQFKVLNGKDPVSICCAVLEFETEDLNPQLLFKANVLLYGRSSTVLFTYQRIIQTGLKLVFKSVAMALTGDP